MKWKVLLIVALLAGGGLAVGASLGVFGAASTSAATSYLTAQAEVADVVDEVAATGTVAPAKTYGLAFGTAPREVTSSDATSNDTSSITWPVTKVAVAVGDRVTKGEVLAAAATTDLKSQIADASRAYAAANVQLAQATTSVANATTTDAARQAKLSLYNAETGVAHAFQTLQDLKARLALATLAAPADGVVIAVAVTMGTDAPSGDAIQLAAGPLQVTTSVVESDITSITLGQTATVTVAALDGTTLEGTVASIAPSGSAGGNNGVVSFDVSVSLTSAPATLRPGMSADVTITTATAPGVLAIPSRALSGTAGAYRVRVLAADGTISTREVTVGLVTDSLVEIKSGLTAGERVITGTSSSQNATNRVNGAGGGTFNGPGVQVVRP